VADLIVLDASVLIGYLDRADPHHADAEVLLVAALDEDLAVNTLTLAEVLVGPARHGRLAELRAALGDLDVRELALPPDAAARLAVLRVGTGLRLPDCCVLLSAQDAGGQLASFDVRLARAARELGLAVLTA
jgi:predicted nucleic acid-binding protein